MTSKTESLQGDSLKRRASLVGALINILQTIIKISFGIVGQSTALIVDGLHSLSDLLSDILVIIAVRMGSRSADGDHPYGHRRFETIATGVLGISLVVMSASIVWHVVEHLNDPSSLPRPEKLTLFVAGVSIVLNNRITLLKENTMDFFAPYPNEHRRSISDIAIDHTGVLWVSAASDPGDNGVFQSALYHLGQFVDDKAGIHWNAYGDISIQSQYENVKVEGLTFVGDKLIMGSDDENLGSKIAVESK